MYEYPLGRQIPLGSCGGNFLLMDLVEIIEIFVCGRIESKPHLNQMKR